MCRNVTLPVSPHSRDESSAHLQEEVKARTLRVHDLSQVAENVAAQASVQQYWRRELDALSTQNEQWRQATERENALARQCEASLLPVETRNRDNSRQVIDGDYVSLLSKHADEVGRLNAAMFPHSVPPVNKIHDPQHPQYVDTKLKVRQSHAHYVSPSISKLGLTMQLGKSRQRNKAARDDRPPCRPRRNGNGLHGRDASSRRCNAGPP